MNLETLLQIQDDELNLNNEVIEHLSELYEHTVNLNCVRNIQGSYWNEIDEEDVQWYKMKPMFECLNLMDLVLDHNMLKSIPSEIRVLKNLTHLDLSHNNIPTFPNEITSLHCLTTLLMNNNSIREISYVLSPMINLRYLNLSSNRIEMNGDDVFEGLFNLEILDLSNNNISYFPLSICSCTALEILNLSHNKIGRSLPEKLTCLKRLTTISLNDNYLLSDHFSSINGKEIGPIKCLNIGSNKITNIPCFIWTVLTCTTLNIGYNNILQLSDELSKLQHLVSLDLSRTMIEDVSEGTCQLCNLQELVLNHCINLKKFPKFPNGTRIRYLDLSGTCIQIVPDDVQHMTSLEILLLNSCKQLEHIPTTILSNLPKLNQLDIHYCDLLQDPPIEVIDSGFATLVAYMNGSISLRDIKKTKTRAESKQERLIKVLKKDPETCAHSERGTECTVCHLEFSGSELFGNEEMDRSEIGVGRSIFSSIAKLASSLIMNRSGE